MVKKSKTVFPKNQCTRNSSKPEDFEKELDESIKAAARAGIQLITEMITDTDCSDASRLAAAKWAIERAAAKDDAGAEDNSITAIMQIIRQMNQTKEQPAPALPKNEAKGESADDWKGWIDSNVN